MKKILIFLLILPLFTRTMNWWPEPKEERIKARQERAQQEEQRRKATHELRELIGPIKMYREKSYWTRYKAKRLLQQGADGNARNYPCQSPLTWTTQAGYIDMVQLLISRGVDINATDTFGDTALRAASYFNNSNNNKLIKLLLDEGADPNPTPPNGGETPLMLAIHYRNETATQYLIDAGAYPDTRASFGKHALWLAVSYHLHNITKLLLQAGANPNLHNFFGQTVLFRAVEINNVRAVSLLLENRANIEIRNYNRQNALDLARSRHNINPKIIQLLENPPPPKSLRKLL